MLLNYLRQPTSVAETRICEESHQLWTVNVVSKVVLGDMYFWDHPEYLAFKEGFDLRLAMYEDEVLPLSCVSAPWTEGLRARL